MQYLLTLAMYVVHGRKFIFPLVMFINGELKVDCSKLRDVHLCVQLLCLNIARVYTEMYRTQNGHFPVLSLSRYSSITPGKHVLFCSYPWCG